LNIWNLEISDIIKKVRALEIRSKKLSTQLFSGEYHAAFKGKGMLFKEVRDYYPGDDIRFIDWNVSARFGHPFSKVFEEERERTVMLMLDMSGSNTIGSVNRSKKDLMIEIAAVLAFSAYSNGDKTGAILFTDKVEKYIAPKKGRQHLLYIVRTLIGFEPQNRMTDLREALQFLRKTSRNRTILFLMSDFAVGEFSKSIMVAGQRHDAISIHLHDPVEDKLPQAGLIPLEDAESGQIAWVDSNDKTLQKQWPLLQQRRKKHIESAFKKAGWEYLYCSTPDDEMAMLQKFFLKRLKH
jgi:uncharacterized protein (DUF58 family)